ncbi:MAG: glycosyltransferase, partial [Candidatus Thorarchaeota archaeon]
MSCTVIIPTLNEAENIEALIRQVYGELNGDVAVLVVDDNSHDGTQEIVQRLARDLNGV